ncbi:MAG: bifunctional precorrin-2 dehydrogenase/sirohydrochlorin ferrochelatase [Deltaproteobacteria bacterium]|nr:bifunctional precorrin-2 dehydrogenase/sirohydrochlorin ferrochelatase [Deltaproteobacteria bacterium]MCL4873382.1 bifunctional precorrin-2 dehydrogenase/sirohydrochlorin ferrochelatase [bacterium]
MRYYPVFLDLKDRPCLVVGGGPVAERKALGLLAAGANVTVVGPRVTEALEGLARKKEIALEKRAYRPGDAKGRFLVVAATASRAVNEAVQRDAEVFGCLLNVVDDPARSNFIVPSVVRRGALTIAISTSGKSPYLARVLREEFEGRIGAEYEDFIEILGAARKKLLKTGLSRDKKERIIKALVKSPIPALLKEGRIREVNSVLRETLGQGYTLSKLGVRLKGEGRG